MRSVIFLILGLDTYLQVCRNGDVPAKICVKSLEKAVIFSLLLYHIQALAFSFSNFT